MTTAMNALRKLVRSHHAKPVHLDARILRDIGLLSRRAALISAAASMPP